MRAAAAGIIDLFPIGRVVLVKLEAGFAWFTA
jgi:hypothetical protein